MHNQIQYTQEGTPYIIKTVNKINFPVVIPTTTTFDIYAVTNPDSSFTDDFNNIKFDTHKRIIPISFNFCLGLDPPVIDIQPVFTYCTDGSVSKSVGNNSYLAKMFPYVIQDYFTDNQHYSFSYRYKDITYSDSDFMDTSGPLYIYPTPSRGASLINGSPSLRLMTVPAGTYNTSISFTYFELL